MPDSGEVEKKIAKLQFNVDTTALDTINQKLAEVETKSLNYVDKINENLNGALNLGNIINTDQLTAVLQKSLKNIENISDKDISKIAKKAANTYVNSYTKELGKQKAQVTGKQQKSDINVEETARKEAIRTAEQKIRQSDKAANRQIQNDQRVLKSTQTIADKIQEYAKTYVIYQGFNKLKQVITETIDEMVELEYKMVEIDRVLNDNSLNIDNYRDKLIQLAYDYGNSFDNVADVTLRLAQAGFNADESLALTEKTLLALNTAELDATQATEDMVAVMSQFGLTTGSTTEIADNYGNIIDKINKVADNFPTTSEDILEALKKTGSAFHLAGASIDETIATIVAAEKASQRGGKVIGTALSNIVQQLKAEGKINIMEDLGLDIYTDSTKTEFKGIMEILEQLSQKMQALKNAGKENSVEMQNLLEVFTVFRRNVGSSLLGEMAGEDSTYAEVLKTSIDSVGYSLEENAKHMNTAKAAQAQFNAELLKLKTEVWDQGLEEVFRNMLSFGKDVVGGINDLIKNIGALPTVIGTVVLAFSVLNKNFKAVKYNSETSKMEIAGFVKKIVEGTKEIKNTRYAFKEMSDGQIALGKVVRNNGQNFLTTSKSLVIYGTKTALATLRTIGLQAATIALNAALTFGLSAAITAVNTAIDEWIHYDEKKAEQEQEELDLTNERIQKKKEEISSLQEETTTINNLTKEYEKYGEKIKKSNLSEEDYEKIYELQENINKELKNSGEQIELIKKDVNEYGDSVWKVNKAYDAQLTKLQSIEYQKQKELTQQKSDLVDSYKTAAELTKVTTGEGGFSSPWKSLGLLQGLADIGKVSESVANDWGNAASNLSNFVDELNSKSLEDRVNILKEMKESLQDYINSGKADQQTKEAYNWIEDEYNKQKAALDNLNTATQDYKDSLLDLYKSKGFVDSYTSDLYSILKNYDSQSANEIANSILNINKQFKEGTIDSSKYFTTLNENIKKIDFSVINKQVNSTREAATKAINAGKYLQDNLSGTIDIISTRLKQNVASTQVIDYAESIGKTEEEVDNLRKGLNKLFNTTRGEFFGNLKESIVETKDSLIEFTKSISEIPEKADAEALQAIFTSTTQMIVESVSALNAQFSENEINFVEYTNGIKEAASSALELYASQNQLVKEQGDVWRDNSNAANEYANKLQTAIDKLNTMAPLLKVIGDNYDYIAKNSNEAGEAAFTAADMQTAATQELVSQFTLGLQQMKDTNKEAYDAIIAKAYSALGQVADESVNVDEYVIKNLNSNNNAFNAALDEAATQTARKAGDVTVSMGDVFTALGDAIKEFDFNIKATPYITGSLGLHKDKDGMIDGIQLPTFGFDIKGSGGDSFQTLGEAIKTFGSNLTKSGSQKYKYTELKTNNNPYTSGGPKTTTPAKTPSSTSKSDAEKQAEEEYKNKLEAYKNYVSDLEELEKRWVNKEKELGQLGTEDFIYITQQRIERYKKYLADLNNMTWLSVEDRAALEKEYTQQIEDLQVDYLGYLKDRLDEEIKAIQDANDKKIEAIKDEAEARINALKKVEDENDRIRTKEEYEKKRQEHLTDISYWEQRTGREAQEALLEARKNLQELDEEWNQQLEDWSIEDQIQAIEDERDAQIKAIEDAQEAEIKALQDIYDAKVKLFAETGQLIYENSAMQSEALYNIYKTNFIDPILNDLAKVNGSQTATPSTSSTSNTEGQYETYTIQRGDNLSRIASKFGTTVDKILAANPYIKNKNLIYSGNTLQIPKFHEGGETKGIREGFALLKPNEIILKPAWAEDFKNLIKLTKKQNNNINPPVNSIQVEGDLIKIEANVRNQNDIEMIGKKVEKVLKDKFNIKK